MILAVLITLHIIDVAVLGEVCPSPDNQHCFPPNGKTCITEVQNGTGLNWFEMENACAVHDGRLVYMTEGFNLPVMTSTLKSANHKTYESAQFLSIGMMMSLNADDSMFWITPGDNQTFSCGTEDTGICLPYATPEQCNTIGCCWLNETCQYPELQRLTLANSSIKIDTSTVTKTERSCVGLKMNGTSWIWKAYNCSIPGRLGTGFVCEYKCKNEWPDLPQMNISWIRPVLTTIPYADDTSTPNASTNVDSTPTVGLHVSSQKTSDISNSPKIDNGRNNSTFTFKKKIMMQIIGLPIVYLITMMSV